MSLFSKVTSKLMLALAVCLGASVCNVASAIVIKPTSPSLDSITDDSYDGDYPSSVALFEALYEPLIYAVQADQLVESGMFKDSIESSFDPVGGPTPPTSGLLNFQGLNLTGSSYLFVAGLANYYFFELTGVNGYTGLNEDIKLEEFFPDTDLITFVAVFGNGTAVPEPATLSMLVIGLGCVAGRRALRRAK